MERFRKILVSVSAASPEVTPQSLVRAIKLAKDTGAELRVVDVIPQPSAFLRRLFHGETAAHDLLAAEHERHLHAICERLKASGIPISTAVLSGRPFVEVIQEVERLGCDLLMRDAVGEQEKSSLFFGSVDMRLIRNCPCPVWLVKPKPVMYFERVIVAIDPLPGDVNVEMFNGQLLDIASSLANWEGGSLFVVSACSAHEEPFLASKMSPSVFQEHLDDITALGRRNLDRALRKLAKRPPEERILYRNGEPAHVITRYASEIDADVIVMGSLARLGAPGMLVGNTAERVLRQVRCSVLTIKPKNFVSPVLAELLKATEGNGDR